MLGKEWHTEIFSFCYRKSTSKFLSRTVSEIKVELLNRDWLVYNQCCKLSSLRIMSGSTRWTFQPFTDLKQYFGYIWLIWPVSPQKLNSDLCNSLEEKKTLPFLDEGTRLNLEWNLSFTTCGCLCINAEIDIRIKSWTIRDKYLKLN